MAQIHRFDGNPRLFAGAGQAAIRRPREITCFSYDEEHQLRHDASSLRYYYPPLLPCDLSAGFDTFRHVDDSVDEHLDSLLDAIVEHEKTKGSKVETDIITWRGMMTKIMVSPFSYLDDWEMNATVFQDTLFIEESHEKKLDSRQNQYTAPAHPGAMSQDLMSYWGYKFETVALLDKPWSDATREDIESREKMVVSNYAQYCSIVRTGFGRVKIVIGGEVDAVQDFKPVDKSQQVNWVELKTTALIQNEKDQVKFERKLLKFWAQSFLLGVPKIVVGYRNHQGLLERVEELDTQAIPEKVRLQGRGLWDGQACINFASSFLEWLKGVVVEEGVWKIRKREKSSVIEVYKAVETGHGDILSAKFVEWRSQGLPQPQQRTQPSQPSQPMEQPQDGPT